MADINMTDASIRFHQAVELLARGDYERGWPLYEARHAYCGRPLPDLPFPWWRGEDLAGKRLLILPDQGFGDAIQFARFLPEIVQRGAQLTLYCRPELERLFAINFPGVQVVALSGSSEVPEPDFVSMMTSLGDPLGVRLENLPASPYLRVRHPLCEGGIGVVYKGNPAHTNDANRSLSPELGARLLALPGAVPLDPVETLATDFYDTAGIIAGLDLVISADTAVAHLAGAMGKPCWVMVPATNTDWRWMIERTDSPWYPSVRLFRQPRGASWEGVVQEVEAAIRAADRR